MGFAKVFIMAGEGVKGVNRLADEAGDCGPRLIESLKVARAIM